MSKPYLLVVDDEADNLDALERIFRKKYHFLRANSGAEALGILSQQPEIDVLITDQRMPQMTGVELLEKTLTTHPQTVRILLTGYTEIDSIIAAVNQGHIFRYLTKPWDTTDLVNSVDQAMEHYSRGRQLERKNQELEQALRELQKLDEAKSRFMILINHELKTPLTVIRSFLDLLLESRLDQDQLTYLDRISKSTRRLQDVIDDTLILTQHAAGALKPKPQATSIAELCQSTFDSLKEELQKKSLRGIVQLPTDLNSNLVVDPVLIKRVLHHLLSNAIRFAPAGSKITCELQPAEKGLCVTLENEGTPIPEAVLAKIHTPFNLQSEIMNHSKGLGLGLSVAEAILQIHQSRLDIENREIQNQNAKIRVSFLLPL